jgi:nitrite reductase/ring-hydroxylating ferredoxin subunit
VWVEAAKVVDVVPGGMKFAKVAGNDVTLCNCGGELFAVSRRCGHMNAPLDQGTLDGYILTCPLHFGQFDVRDGSVLAYPVDLHYGPEPLSQQARRVLDVSNRLMKRIRVYDLATWPVRVAGDVIEIDV